MSPEATKSHSRLLEAIEETRRRYGFPDIEERYPAAMLDTFFLKDAIALYEQLEAEQAKTRRAVYLATHLMQMISPETWRDSGGDDGQGHYEGEYRADSIASELEALVSNPAKSRTISVEITGDGSGVALPPLVEGFSAPRTSEGVDLGAAGGHQDPGGDGIIANAGGSESTIQDSTPEGTNDEAA